MLKEKPGTHTNPIRWTDRSVLFAMTDPEKAAAGNAETATAGPAAGAEGSLGYHEDLKVSDFIRVEGHEMLVLCMPCLADETATCGGMCFYDKNRELLKNRGVVMDHGRECGKAVFHGDGCEENVMRERTVPTGSFAVTTRIYVPGEAAYFRTTWWRDEYLADHCPEISFTYGFTCYSDESRPFTNTLPTCTEMNNVIKRARQLTDIRWEPLVDIPRYCLMYSDYSGQSETHFLDWCKVGCEYTGIPYSGAGEPDRNTKHVNPQTFCGRWGYYKFHVGIDIDFETFVTAARYPDSILGERKDRTEPSFDSSPYGTYCSALVGYAFGYRQPLPKVAEFCEDEDYVKVNDHLTDVCPDDILLCDIIRYGAFHIAVITDLVRDDEGKVTRIEVSEATTVGNGNNTVLNNRRGGLCRRKMWPVEELYAWYREYALFRRKSFHGIRYQKSEFVDVGNETGSMPVVDLPLIPYLGNRARYKKGHIADDRILVGAEGFTEVILEKDGKLFQTIPIEKGNFVHGGFTEEGSYVAYLSDGTTRTRCCRWTVEL